MMELVCRVTNTSNFLSLLSPRGVDSALGVLTPANSAPLEPEMALGYFFFFEAPTTPGVYERSLTWSAFSSNGLLHSRTLAYTLIVDVNPIDTDLDGMPNLYEIDHGLDPFSDDDASSDLDRDGYKQPA